MEKGAKLVVVKRGGEGSHVFTSSGVHSLPSFRVNVLDPTGSGDEFDSAFIYGVLKGFELEKCHEYAAAAGAISVAGYGAKAQPTTKEIEAFLKIHKE